MCFKTEGKVVDRFKIYKPLTFKYGYNFPENYHIKSIIHKECEGHFRNPHSIQVDNAYNPSSMKVDKGVFSYMDYEILYIRHYFTKSLEEWVDNKMPRNGGNNPHFKYGLDKYFAYNDITEEKINFLKDRGIEYNGEIFNGYYNNVSKKERG